MVLTVLETILAVLLVVQLSLQQSTDAEVIRPGEQLFGVYQNFATPEVDNSRRYTLRDVVPGATYELKISYLGSMRVRFKFEVRKIKGLHQELRPQQLDQAYYTRRLLDVEKLVFTITDRMVYQEQEVTVKAFLASVVPPGTSYPKGVTYNIMLDRQVLGGLPFSTLPFVSYLVVLAIVIVSLVIRSTQKPWNILLRWVFGDVYIQEQHLQ